MSTTVKMTDEKGYIVFRRGENGALCAIFHDGFETHARIIYSGETWEPPTAWRKASVRPSNDRADDNVSVSIETDSGGYISSIKNTEPQPMQTEAKIALIKKLLRELPSDEDRRLATEDVPREWSDL